MSQPSHSPPVPLVFWVIWAAILSGLIIMQFFMGGGIPAGGNRGGEPVIYQAIALGIALGIAAAALAVRFIVIPRVSGLDRKLPLMIVGLALSESIGIIGIFVIRQEHSSTRLFMLGTAIVCIVLSAPVYARLAPSGSPFRNDPTPRE